METINKKVIKDGWDRRERNKFLEKRSLHSKAQRTAIKLGQWLKDEWNVKEVFLFGSLAWSEHYDHLSDIDLFVVGFEYEADYYRMLAKAMDVAHPIPINIVLEEDALQSLKDRVKEEGIRL